MAAPPVGMHVLAVDDDPLALMVLQRMLQRCQYRVTTCTRVAAALELLRENKDCFDLVMSDVYMPDADGFKLLEIVGLELDIPVIMMSANGETSVVMKGITHGACDYLIKPIRMEELKTIWQHVARRRSRVIKTGSLEVGDLDDVLSGKGNDMQEDGIKTSGKEELHNTYTNDLTEEDINTTKKNQVHWSAPLHEKFVMAVNELGVNKASPRRILEIMDTPGLTKEHVASHLRKYKLTLKRLSGVSAQPGPPKKAIHSYGDMGSAGMGREEARQGSSTTTIAKAPEFGENSGLLRTISRDPGGMGIGIIQRNVMPGMSATEQQKIVANRAQVLGGLGLKHGDGPKAPNTRTALSGRKLRGGSADVSMQRSTLTGVLSTGGIGNPLGGSGGLGNSGGLYRMGSLDIGLLLKIQQEEEEEQKQREASRRPVDDAIAAFNSKHAIGGTTGSGHRGLDHQQTTQMRKVTRPPTARSLVNALPLPTASVDPQEAEGIMTPPQRRHSMPITTISHADATSQPSPLMHVLSHSSQYDMHLKLDSKPRRTLSSEYVQESALPM